MVFKLKQMKWAVAPAIFSGAMYFLGSGLHPIWYLTWFAPLPVLLVAPKTRSLRAFVIASVAYTIGGINMWHYYRELVPLGIALLVVLGPSLVFGLIVLVFRGFCLRGQLSRAMFSVPLLWVAFQYLQ
jgi:apolipoprotein N-acyltransferase